MLCAKIHKSDESNENNIFLWFSIFFYMYNKSMWKSFLSRQQIIIKGQCQLSRYIIPTDDADAFTFISKWTKKSF